MFKWFVETVEDDTIAGIIKRITQYEIDPQQAVDELLRELDFPIMNEYLNSLQHNFERGYRD